MSFSRKKIQSLTPLRGVAALIVAMHHFNGFLFPDFGETVAKFTLIFQRGYLWVDFFFILSGFILTHVYLARFEDGLRWKNYFYFMYSRFTRIYPLHITMLICFCGLVIYKAASMHYLNSINSANFLQSLAYQDDAYGVYSLGNLIKNLCLIQSLTFSQLTNWNQPSWSLSVEWAAYFIFPVYVSIVYRLPAKKRILLAISLVIGIYLLQDLTEGHLDIEGFYGLARCLIEAVLGVIAYRIYSDLPDKHFLENEKYFLFLLAACFLLMSLPTSDAVVIPFLFFMLLSAAKAKGRVTKLLNSSPMIFLGDISFAIYMTNWFIVVTARKVFSIVGIYDKKQSLLTGFMLLSIFLIIVITTSAVLRRYVEISSKSFLKKKLKSSSDYSTLG